MKAIKEEIAVKKMRVREEVGEAKKLGAAIEKEVIKRVSAKVKEI